MGNVTLARETNDAVTELLPLWVERTSSEDEFALIARSIVDALLDLKAFTSEFDDLDVKSRTAK